MKERPATAALALGAMAILVLSSRLDLGQPRPSGAYAKPPPRRLQAGNLLANPGFEEGFSQHGGPELVVGDGWTPWFDGQLVRPEFKDEPYVRRRPDGSVYAFSLRVFHGANVQKFFSSSSTHDAGFYQQAQVVPGTRLRFSIWVHSWSSDCDDPCVSPLIPCRPGSDNSHGTYRLQVGIEPTGRMPDRLGEPAPESVRWSEPVVFEAYERWVQLSVEARAEGEWVTVYTRGHPLWPVKHNDSYWDEARLEVRVGPTATATATASPTTPPSPTATPSMPTLTPSPTGTASVANVYLPLVTHRFTCGTTDPPAPVHGLTAPALYPAGERLITCGPAAAAQAAARPQDPVPPAADVRIEYPIRAHPGQENFNQPNCSELAFESLVVRNHGTVPVAVGDWTLVDREGNRFVFPPFTLDPGDSVRVWTQSGEDVTDGRFTDVYWNRAEPVWNNNADEAVIRDEEGTEVARRGYP